MNAMDEATQLNSKMVDESNDASRSLAGDAEALFALISRFRMGLTANIPWNPVQARSETVVQIRNRR